MMKPVSERYDPQQEQQNAAMIAFELEIVSRKQDRFGWDRLDDAVKQRLSDDWTDVLRAYPVEAVREGVKAFLSKNPRKSPHEEDIKAEIERRRAAILQAAPRAPEPEEPNRERITPERAAEIMREAGLQGVPDKTSPAKFEAEQDFTSAEEWERRMSATEK